METAEHPVAPAVQQRVLDRYRLVRRLGSGGFGVVWLAHDERLDRAVAIKRIPVDGGSDAAARAEREALAAARLSHPAIVALYEAGADDDAVYLVSELVRGRTLADLILDGELSDRDVLRVGGVLCEALEHAHARGVIHRDVKPGNVIVPERRRDGDPVAKLTDFGVARMLGDDALTRTGDVVGTLAYMAPEQAEGRAVTAAADLYALALVLYEALAGVNPVRAQGAASTARRVGRRLPPLGRLRRDLPEGLTRAIDAAVAPKPDHRGTVAGLRRALADALTEVGDEQGTVTGGRLEGVALPRPVVRSRPSGRVIAALGAAALTASALHWLGPAPAVAPLAGAAGAAGLVLALPRAGWLMCAALLCIWLTGAGAPGTAVVVGGAGLAVVVLLRGAPGSLWSLPVLAPLLGTLGIAGAWPALAGQARRPVWRAALGALGFWWLALAEPLVGRTLLLGPAPHTEPRGAWEGSAGHAFQHVLGPLLGGGALAIALLWAGGALVLPLLVRGRSAAVDAVGATAWAAGLAAATQAIAGALSWPGGAPHPRGVVAGAIAAGLVAVVACASRGEP